MPNCIVLPIDLVAQNRYILSNAYVIPIGSPLKDILPFQTGGRSAFANTNASVMVNTFNHRMDSQTYKINALGKTLYLT